MIKTDDMPLVDGLIKYISEDVYPFHMPGHKAGRGFENWFKDNIVKMDLTEIPNLDYLHDAEGIIKKAQHKAAKAFGADETRFLVGGSTAGITAMIMGCCRRGDRLIVARNSHKAVWNAIAISGVEPISIWPAYHEDKAMTGQITPQQIENALEENPDAIGAVIVSPDYYGMCADLCSMAGILHKKNKILMIDEAHGAHFPFSLEMPESASKCDADIWVQSAHKTLSAFTQGAYLHYQNDNIDGARIDTILKMIQSSSPSYMIMASLDYARHQMETQGAYKISTMLEYIKSTSRELADIGLFIEDGSSLKGVFQKDPSRLVIDVTAYGITGYEAEQKLRQSGIQTEMSDVHRLVLIPTIADDEECYLKLIDALKSIEKGTTVSKYEWNIHKPKAAMMPWKILDAEWETIHLDKSAGRISASIICTYPPGIPIYVMGEVIDTKGIEQIEQTLTLGGSLYGVKNHMIRVVK